MNESSNIKPPKNLSNPWKIVWYRTWGRSDADFHQKHIKNLFEWKVIDNFSAKEAMYELYETRWFAINTPVDKLEKQFANAFAKLEES